MKRNRATFLVALVCLGLLAVFSAPAAFAQDDPAPEEAAETTEPAPAEEPADDGKVGFFGDRFALYIDVAGGGASPEDFNTSIDTTNTTEELSSINTISFDDFKNAQVAVGWTLPYDRGALEVVFDGYTEDGFTLTAEGKTDLDAVAFDPLPGQVTWWWATLSNGQYVAEQFPPVWTDGNGNGLIDDGELQYPSTPAVRSVRPSVTSLDNQWQTWDVLYRRGFGGRRFAGRWSAGARYFAYEGNTIAPVWLGGGTTGFGYTEGAAYTPLTFNLETTGFGPTGSLGLLMRFFRERLVLSLDGRLAFALSTMESDTGNFFVLVADTSGSLAPSPARMQSKFEKDVWHLHGTVGAQWRIVGGLSIGAEYYRSAYQDVVIATNIMSIPVNTSQATGRPPTTVGQPGTTDLRVDGWRFRLRFEF